MSGDPNTVCNFHSNLCAGVKNALPWKVFIWVFGVVLVVTLAYVGFIQSQQININKRVDLAIEKTHKNRESLIAVEVTQSAIMKNVEQLVYSRGMIPDVSSRDVENKITKEKDKTDN